MYSLAWWLIEIWSQEIVCYIYSEKLESHLAFIFSLIYRKWWSQYFVKRRVDECIQFLSVWDFFFTLFIETLAIAGSSASTKNMQKNLNLKLRAFCSERRHLPWGQRAALGVRKVGQILYWGIRCDGDSRGSCRLHVPASSLQPLSQAVGWA